MDLQGMHHKTFHKKADMLYDKLGDFENHLFGQTAEYVRQVHARHLGVTLDSSDVLDISISFDDTWLTRGHSSHIGVGCVVDLLAGLCLDAHVMCTYCHVCETTSKKIYKDTYLEYAGWLVQHLPKCEKNLTGELCFFSWSKLYSSDMGLGKSEKGGKWCGGLGAAVGPQWGPGAKPLVGVWGRCPQKLKFFSVCHHKKTAFWSMKMRYLQVSKLYV